MKGFFLVLITICVAYVGFLAGSTKWMVESGSMPFSGDCGIAVITIVFLIVCVCIARGWKVRD